MRAALTSTADAGTDRSPAGRHLTGCWEVLALASKVRSVREVCSQY